MSGGYIGWNIFITVVFLPKKFMNKLWTVSRCIIIIADPTKTHVTFLTADSRLNMANVVQVFSHMFTKTTARMLRELD